MRALLIWPVLLALLPAPALAESEISGYVLGSGGGSVTTSTHSLQYTVGQLAVGSVGTTAHELHAGFWADGDPVVTAIGPDTPRAVDRLLPNVPNPFNPATSIAYELAEAGPVRVSVYDVAGRAVARLIDEHKSAGRHSVTWRGATSNGASVASGVYLFVLDTPRARFMRKSVLLR